MWKAMAQGHRSRTAAPSIASHKGGSTLDSAGMYTHLHLAVINARAVILLHVLRVKFINGFQRPHSRQHGSLLLADSRGSGRSCGGRRGRGAAGAGGAAAWTVQRPTVALLLHVTAATGTGAIAAPARRSGCCHSCHTCARHNHFLVFSRELGQLAAQRVLLGLARPQSVGGLLQGQRARRDALQPGSSVQETRARIRSHTGTLRCTSTLDSSSYPKERELEPL